MIDLINNQITVTDASGVQHSVPYFTNADSNDLATLRDTTVPELRDDVDRHMETVGYKIDASTVYKILNNDVDTVYAEMSIPEGGVYLLTGHACFNTSSTSGLRCVKSGIAPPGSSIDRYSMGQVFNSPYPILSFSRMFFPTGSRTVQLSVHQNSGSSCECILEYQLVRLK